MQVSMWVLLAGLGFCCSESFELHALDGLHGSIFSEFVLEVSRSSVELLKPGKVCFSACV